MTHQQSLLNHLHTHGRISLLGAVKTLGITNPSAVVSQIRKQYGRGVIETKHVSVLNNSGTAWINLPEYELTTEGRNKIWPVKKTWPQWITQYENKRT